ncbi:DeoR family transcriptional regulator [Streptomyces sp. NPDC004069]
MSAATTRQLRRERVRQLAQSEPELSHRAIAARLGLSKDTVRRDLEKVEQMAQNSGAAADEPEEPQVVAGGADESVPTAEPDASDRVLPKRVAQPLAGIDLSQWPAVRRDLAVLAQTGRSAESLAHQAIVEMAHQYRQALARGELVPGQPFIVTDMVLRPLPVPASRDA